MPRLSVSETKTGGLTLDPRGTGRFLVQIIDVGEGSSADYTDEALRDAAETRIFPAGTHMYLDHATPTKRGPHGERSVRDLASVLTTDAVYEPEIHALVAEAQAVTGYEDALEALAPHVGLSIRAVVEVDPPAQPGGKPIARRFLAAESVDWVVRAGRGGAVLAILESAGTATEAGVDDRRQQLTLAIRAAYTSTRRDRDAYAYVHDFDDLAGLCWFSADDALWQQPYTVADDDLSVTLTDTRIEVRAVTQYIPVTSPAGVAETHKEKPMPEIPQAELDRLTGIEAQLTITTKRAEEAEAENAALRATANAARIATATSGLPAQMAARISEAFATRTDEVTEAELLAAVATEKTYAAAIATESGKLVGFGATTTTATVPRRTHNAFGRKIEEN